MRFLIYSFLAVVVALSGPISVQAKHRAHPDSESVWHLHTGEGVEYKEVFDPDTGEYFLVPDPESSCVLDPAQPTCEEKVIFFEPATIEEFIDIGVQKAQSELAMHGAIVSAGIAIGAASKAGLKASLATGNVWGVVGSGVVGAVSLVTIAWSGYEAAKVTKRIFQISDRMKSERAFVNRCGHVRKNFFQDLAQLGIHVSFDTRFHWRSISSEAYFGAIEKENELYKETLQIAFDESRPVNQVYEEHFLEQCGQIASLEPTEGDLAIGDLSGFMPPDILLETRDLSEKLELQSGAGVQWSGFQKKHVDKKAERNSLRRFLAYAKRDFEEFSDAYPKQLEELRTEVAEIHFLPERKKGRRFETLNQEGRKRLLIYFRKEDGRWEGSLKPYLERRFGITLHP